MKTVTELRDKLLDNIKKMESGELDKTLASEIANHAGKIIKTAAVELLYNISTGQKEKLIDFLQGKKVIESKSPYKIIDEINEGK